MMLLKKRIAMNNSHSGPVISIGLPSHLNVLDESEEDVGVDGALVGLVENDDRVPPQLIVAHCLAQQHAVRQELTHRLAQVKQ